MASMAPRSYLQTCVWYTILWSAVIFLDITDQQVANAFNVANPYPLTKEQIGLISSFCGLSNSPKIIGGTETGPHEFPWMAFILTNITNHFFLCGGSLITNRHVLTAAHCLENAVTEGVTVFLGVHNIFNLSNSGAIILKVSKFKIHPDYTTKAELSGSDIAVITLNNSVKFNSRILPICLPAPNLFGNYEGQTATVIGWGKRVPGGGLSSVLMKVNVPIVSRAICKEIYGKGSQKITPKMLCAGKNGSDTCSGDSGGPLMLMKRGRYYIIGIVSFGDVRNCGTEGLMGVYTKVASFIKFILEAMINN